MTGGELDEFIHQVVASGTLLEVGSEVGGSQQPKELLRSTMTANSTTLDKFLTALGEGLYDTTAPKSKVSPCEVESWPTLVSNIRMKRSISDGWYNRVCMGLVLYVISAPWYVDSGDGVHSFNSTSSKMHNFQQTL